MSSAKKSLTSFPTWISFSSLLALARISKTVLNKSGENGYPCFIPDLRGNAFSFSLRIYCQQWICPIWPLPCWGSSLYAHFLESFFNHKWTLNFIKSFFSCIYWDDHMVFILQSVNVWHHIHWFVDIEKPFHSWNKY